ncbi:MAG: cytochrome c oxidase subunit 4 [Acidimicrobiia bacterium]|nr:cytochrome c oxidase subunit 4 [Acidimicrobiia bacterium]
MSSDADAVRAGGRIEARMYLGIALFLALAGAIYLLFAYEEAGTVLLVVGAAMGLLLGGFLEVQARRRSDPAEGGETETGEVAEPEAYLPHASIWPFGVGLGAVLLLNGLALGLWAVLPGAAVTAGSAWGYARQSKRRD